MEMAINVIIVLFVALAVGFLLINFADEILGNAGKQLPVNGNEEEEYPQIYKLTDVSSEKVASLSEMCWKDNINETIENVTCYILNGPISANQSGIEANLIDLNADKLNIDLSGGGKTVYIEFNAIDLVIDIHT